MNNKFIPTFFLNKLVLLFLNFILISCILPFDFKLNNSNSILIIEGKITDEDVPQIISIQRNGMGNYTNSEHLTSVKFDSLLNIPEKNAIVTLIVNGSYIYQLLEVDDGKYQAPYNFKGKVGNNYQLKFTTKDGKSYETGIETMLPVANISKTYDDFDPKGDYDAFAQTYSGVNNVYVDFKDPADSKNYYQWKWTLYESQSICATCVQGYYQLYTLGNRSFGQCIQDLNLAANNYFDSPCVNMTLDIFYSSKINIFSDELTNGLMQNGHLAAQIPLNQSNPCLVQVKQMSITPSAYLYYNNLIKQTQNTGTLADTPPAPSIGNIRNINDAKELIFGYFSCSSVVVQNYYLNRHNTRGGVNNNLFLIQNHRFPEFAYSPYPKFSAYAIPSNTRTIKIPKGWP